LAAACPWKNRPHANPKACEKLAAQAPLQVPDICPVALDENICLRADLLGITTWGGYAQFTKVRQNHLVRLPDALSFEDAVAGTILSSPAISAPSTRQGGERWGRPQIAPEPAIGGWALYPVRDLVLQCTV
jgi:hypothetical protein